MIQKIMFSLVGGFLAIVTFDAEVTAQSVLEQSSEQICNCLDEKVLSDTTAASANQAFAECTGQTMADNLASLSQEFDLNTVQGVISLRDTLATLLHQDCEKFNQMFAPKAEEQVSKDN